MTDLAFTKPLVLLTKVVAASGVAESFVADPVPVNYMAIQAKKATGANTGAVFIGTATVNKTSSQQIKLNPDDKYVMELPVGATIDLKTLFIDADNTGDGITGFYLVG